MAGVSITRRRVLGVLDTILPVLERQAREENDPADHAAFRACGALRGDIAAGEQVNLRRVREVIEGSQGTLLNAGGISLLPSKAEKDANRACDIADDLVDDIAEVEEQHAEQAA